MKIYVAFTPFIGAPDVTFKTENEAIDYCYKQIIRDEHAMDEAEYLRDCEYFGDRSFPDLDEWIYERLKRYHCIDDYGYREEEE